MDLAKLQAAVFKLEKHQFTALALEVFRYQSENCKVYKQFLEHLQVNPSKIINSEEIPFLPIEFFKNFEIKTGDFQAVRTFESSSTTGIGVSQHLVNDLAWYETAFTNNFNYFFGDFRNYCHLALLPSYLERENSSLVYQVNHFIEHSSHKESSFFLHDYEKLQDTILKLEEKEIPTILWGVSFALLDFAEKFPKQLKFVKIIETGGMKGRRKEIVRAELHSILKSAFQTATISGEYGMTELMSQAYAIKDGLYYCPPWMEVSMREINDPFQRVADGKHGAINICDLSNLHSCAFIASSDLGKRHKDGGFEVLGRIDHSDTRGCNLLF